MTKFTILCLLTLLISPLSRGEVATAPTTPGLAPAALFSDSMVLQRDTAVPVWGTAQVGETVTVTFAGQTKTAQADALGKWRVQLDAMPAKRDPQELTIRDTRETKVFKDVLVGDIWLCSGQSNMHFRMNEVADASAEIAAANNPAVRFFSVGPQFAQQPAADVQGAWKPVSPATAAECSAVAWYFAQVVQQKLDVPIGLLVSSVGGTRIETWMSPETLASLGVADPLLEKWKNVSPEEFERILADYRTYQHQLYRVHPEAVRAAKAQGAPIPPEPKRPALRGHDYPGALHHGMIVPLQPFAIRGVLWYQGEANVGGPVTYPKLHSALVADWRKAWGAELPFLFVQLAPHRTATPDFREAQLRAWQQTPNTAMVVTTDVGDAQNIHPTRKRPVGERLAWAALALTYGQPVEYSGPVFSRMTIAGRRAVLSFTHVGGGLVAKGDGLQGFTMAGADGKFVAASAVIQDATVVVTAEGINQPAAVRYGWANVPDVNLYNREGLPAVPFRTDPALTRPNIVFILADDLGWSDLGSYGSTFHETPHLDRLAAQGVRFTQAYAASNVCSPTRASLLTGRYPARVGITDWIVGRPDRPDQKLARAPFLHHLPLEEVTLAEVFRAAGYRTGFIGKWHLGEDAKYFPDQQGFDVNIAGCGKGSPPSYFSPYGIPTLTDGPAGEHLDDRLTSEAIEFVSAAAAKRQPFFLYLSHYAVHNPLQAKPELIAKYQSKLAANPPASPALVEHPQDGKVRVVQSHATYAAMVESLDTSVGRLVATLDELGLRENTIIVFTSDNGGLSTAEGAPTSNLPLRAGKGWAYEGGVREPLIVSWPHRLPAGRTSDAIVTSPDFFPTLLDLAGLPAEPRLHVDGVSFAPVLRDPAARPAERPIYWHYPHYSNQRGKPHSAVRVGRWKLIEWFEDGRTELFDLSADISESNDVSRAHPEISTEMLGQLRAWRERVGARLPTPNLDYQPKS